MTFSQVSKKYSGHNVWVFILKFVIESEPKDTEYGSLYEFEGGIISIVNFQPGKRRYNISLIDDETDELIELKSDPFFSNVDHYQVRR